MGSTSGGAITEPRHWNVQPDKDFCVLFILRDLGPLIQSASLLLQRFPGPQPLRKRLLW